jgi:hypothetical protein
MTIVDTAVHALATVLEARLPIRIEIHCVASVRLRTFDGTPAEDAMARIIPEPRAQFEHQPC